MVTSDFSHTSDFRSKMEIRRFMHAQCIRDNYRNISFIVDLAIGQIPRYRERISSYKSYSVQSYLTPICGTDIGKTEVFQIE